MRIVLVTSEFVHTKDGGLATYTYRLAKYLCELGHKAVVLVPDEISKVSNYHNIELHQLRIDYSKISKRNWFKKSQVVSDYVIFEERSKQVNAYLSKLQPEFVQYSHLGGLGKYRLNKVPCVIRLSSSTRRCFEYGGYGESEVQMLDQERIEFEAIKLADGVFGPSASMAQLTEKATGVNVRIIETPYKEMNIKEDDCALKKVGLIKYILFFGSLVKLKGIETIATILPALFSKYDDIHFVFVGKSIRRKDNTEMSDYLKLSAGAFHNRVHILGSLPQEQLRPIIRSAKLIALPSLIDNFPNACIESMALGKTVIGTNGNGFEQLIDSGVSGFLIDGGRTDQLLGVIEQVLSIDSPKLNQIGENAKTRIALLNPAIVVKELVEYYKEIINDFQKCAE